MNDALITLAAQAMHRRHISGRIPDAVCIDCLLCAKATLEALREAGALMPDTAIPSWADEVEVTLWCANDEPCESDEFREWLKRGTGPTIPAAIANAMSGEADE